MLDDNIECRPFFWPLNNQPAYKKMYKQRFNLKNSEYLGLNGFYIPLGSHINKKKQLFIVNKLLHNTKLLLKMIKNKPPKWFRDFYFYLSIIFSFLVFINQTLFSIYTFFLILFFRKSRFVKYDFIFLLTTFSFYFLRYFSSLSKNFNDLWTSLSPGLYGSDVRFWDLQLNLSQ